MSKILSIAVLTSFLFAACNNSAVQMDDATIQAKADSIVDSKMEGLIDNANEDLDRRMAIEVKPKADSIVKASK